MSKATRKRPRPWRGATSDRSYTNNVIEAAVPGWRRCLRAFATWLEDVQQLALASITVRVGSARSFVEGLDGCGVRALKRLDATAIEDRFIAYGQTHGVAFRRSMQAAMRLFLRFAATRKWVRSDLAEAVPSMRSYRLSSVPRGLSDKSLRALLATPPASARDHTLLLLFATYGIRRGQLCTLVFEDICWAQQTITFRAHKGGKPVTHRLTAAVAERLADYLQHERPAVDEQAVFLRMTKPHLPLGPAAVTAVIYSAMSQAGVTSTPRGPHALRHAFATRLLQGGQPLKVIADLLGHRSLDAVSIYAKVDHPRLLGVAVEWPEVSP